MQLLRDTLLAIRIATFAVSVRVLMRLQTPRLERFLDPGPRRRSADPKEIERIAQLTDLVIKAGKPLWHSVCLTRGVTLYFFLGRAGADVSLAFGVGEVDGKFQGHCWLVRQGSPYLERTNPEPLFRRIFAFEPSRNQRPDKARVLPEEQHCSGK